MTSLTRVQQKYSERFDTTVQPALLNSHSRQLFRDVLSGGFGNTY
jgi:hypothetical protein